MLILTRTATSSKSDTHELAQPGQNLFALLQGWIQGRHRGVVPVEFAVLLVVYHDEEPWYFKRSEVLMKTVVRRRLYIHKKNLTIH